MLTRGNFIRSLIGAASTPGVKAAAATAAAGVVTKVIKEFDPGHPVISTLIKGSLPYCGIKDVAHLGQGIFELTLSTTRWNYVDNPGGGKKYECLGEFEHKTLYDLDLAAGREHPSSMYSILSMFNKYGNVPILADRIREAVLNLEPRGLCLNLRDEDAYVALLDGLFDAKTSKKLKNVLFMLGRLQETGSFSRFKVIDDLPFNFSEVLDKDLRPWYRKAIAFEKKSARYKSRELTRKRPDLYKIWDHIVGKKCEEHLAHLKHYDRIRRALRWTDTYRFRVWGSTCKKVEEVLAEKALVLNEIKLGLEHPIKLDGPANDAYIEGRITRLIELRKEEEVLAAKLTPQSSLGRKFNLKSMKKEFEAALANRIRSVLGL